MTLAELERDYTFYPNTTIINTPGKFEGEQIYVPYYYEIGLDGLADRNNGKVWGFDIVASDKIVFPELKGRRTVKLVQDDMGFVHEV